MQVEGEVQALLARRDFLESDVDHLEQYLVAQRERIVEAVASLNDLVQRVPGGLGRHAPAVAVGGRRAGAGRHRRRRPRPTRDADGTPTVEIVDDPIDEPSPTTGRARRPDDATTQDEIAEITRVASADEAARDATPPSGSLFDEDGEPTQQMAAIDPRDPARG